MEYRITRCSYALVSSDRPEYVTKIYDKNGIFYSKKTKLSLLDEACIRMRGCDYRGQVRAFKKLFGYNKAPVILSLPHIFAIPTKSPSVHDCQWIFLQHVSNLIEQNGRLIIVFKNKQTLELNCSPYTFFKQRSRAYELIVYLAFKMVPDPFKALKYK
ncbi:competence protein ComK [Heyndrickxia ginsengihumi]|uniref:Competence protein ComK n=1 Tax=Heyndrickxia ginsengihumi TaxID=363870 RepID=A0A6M0P9R8_9BACI|nr:competence protein ComK [Heyndrickxia ginsengihumi]MCM3023140.1 competence protein ComK [Heyndrickxia ginsengihumi]NEY19978.1 competence protein ComK [Heyndrickxia ginsengihumi]